MNKFEEFQNTKLDSFLTHEMQLKQAFEFGLEVGATSKTCSNEDNSVVVLEEEDGYEEPCECYEIQGFCDCDFYEG